MQQWYGCDILTAQSINLTAASLDVEIGFMNQLLAVYKKIDTPFYIQVYFSLNTIVRMIEAPTC